MQIDAGVAGRQKGHKYENDLADALNGLKMPYIRTLKKSSDSKHGCSSHHIA